MTTSNEHEFGEPTAPPAERGGLRAALANEIVRIYARYYGRGPTRARTVTGTDYAMCILEDVLTPAERTLAASGRADLVRDNRMAFQQAMRETFVSGAERLTGRRVRAFLSQQEVDPEVAVEIFLFEPENGDDGELRGRRESEAG